MIRVFTLSYLKNRESIKCQKIYFEILSHIFIIACVCAREGLSDRERATQREGGEMSLERLPKKMTNIIFTEIVDQFQIANQIRQLELCLCVFVNTIIPKPKKLER